MGVVEEAFTNVTALSTTGELKSNSLGRKLALKVQQRCALTLLDPLRMNSIAQNTMRQKRKGAPTHSEGAVEVLALTEMGMSMLPRIIDALLQGLCDIDTIVRWSAAKGLGRIAARLPSSCVEDVNNAILELLSPLQTDSGWQGACLAVAEVARQGLLPVHRLPKVRNIAPVSALLVEMNALKRPNMNGHRHKFSEWLQYRCVAGSSTCVPSSAL